MFQFAGETQSCEGFETLIGRALLLLADTQAAQSTARAACHEMNERIAAAYRAHRARADDNA